MALAIGILLAAGAVVYVVRPLFGGSGTRARAPERPGGATPAADSPEAIDPAEAAVLRFRAMRRRCPRCGPRPEPDPSFCSSCGDYLRDACPSCGAPVTERASRFCASCGASLAV